ncbi:MAG TPA: hypothetical protein VG127_00210 [Rubrobacteraceae bacterium]|jgi:hypothetical protein|nr:hypothetical protein [Rubrobacteraceae bacterium]
MTEEERTRFAMVLREAERVRARITEDETATRTEDGGLKPEACGLKPGLQLLADAFGRELLANSGSR